MEKMNPNHPSFTDLTGLTRWVKYVLYTLAVITAVAVFFDFLQFKLISDLDNGLFYSEEAFFDAAQASDNRQQNIGLLYLAVFLFSAILIGRWIYFANQNAHHLGYQNMQFTPGWSVGWSFIPIANLWKPYQVMQEIWVASSYHQKEDAEVSPPPLGWWWFLWLTSNISSRIAASVLLKAETIETFKLATFLSIFSDFFWLILCLTLLNVINKINHAQQQAQALRNQKTPEPSA